MNDTTTITLTRLRRLESAASKLRQTQPEEYAAIFEVDDLLFVGGPLDGQRRAIPRSRTDYLIPDTYSSVDRRREYRRQTLALNLPGGTQHETIMAYYG